ncbi:MAG: divalent-cation tolerance protein CutA [Pirellulales bacterium]
MEDPHTAAICVYTTTDSEQQASSIAQSLVEQRLAACAQISGPIRSVYWWQGRVDSSQEWVCAVKTTPERYTTVEAAIRAVHNYDEPEIVAVPIVAGSKGYLTWLRDSVQTHH